MSPARICEDVAAHWDGDTVYVGLLPGGPLAVFTGSSALIWAMLEDAGAKQLASRVAAAAGVPVETIRADVMAFVAECTSLGLLVD